MKFCIVGTGRCGTTLLWRMMNHHPDLFVFRETHWIVPLHEAFGTGPASGAAMLDMVQRTRHVTGDVVTEIDADAFRRSLHWHETTTVAAFADSVGQFFAGSAGKSIWADKTPDYGAHMAMLQLHWPECQMVHLIRHGMDTARSMAHHPGYQALAGLNRSNWCSLALDYTPPITGFPAAPPERYATLWHDRLARARDEAQRLRAGSYLEVFHEAILADPEAELSRIARHVGIEPHQDWLAQSAGFIDHDRGSTRPAAPEMAASFSGQAGALLASLGY